MRSAINYLEKMGEGQGKDKTVRVSDAQYALRLHEADINLPRIIEILKITKSSMISRGVSVILAGDGRLDKEELEKLIEDYSTKSI